VITPALVTRRAGVDGVPAQAVERDYVQAAVLQEIGDHMREALVFKGGTALRFCFVDGFRYSADLDFSLVGTDVERGRQLVSAALDRARERFAFDLLELRNEATPRIHFIGPLGSERTIKLDLADDELVIDSEPVLLRQQWDDLRADVSIIAYTPVEIAGEKLRCVIQRLQCRDLFDLDVLFESLGVDEAAAAERFVAKASHRGLDPSPFSERFEERIAEYARRWEDELSNHMSVVPHFEGVERRVRRHLRRAGLV
jgi:hypothetical protein